MVYFDVATPYTLFLQLLLDLAPFSSVSYLSIYHFLTCLSTFNLLRPTALCMVAKLENLVFGAGSHTRELKLSFLFWVAPSKHFSRRFGVHRDCLYGSRYFCQNSGVAAITLRRTGLQAEVVGWHILPTSQCTLEFVPAILAFWTTIMARFGIC